MNDKVIDTHKYDALVVSTRVCCTLVLSTGVSIFDENTIRAFVNDRSGGDDDLVVSMFKDLTDWAVDHLISPFRRMRANLSMGMKMTEALSMRS